MAGHEKIEDDLGTFTWSPKQKMRKVKSLALDAAHSKMKKCSLRGPQSRLRGHALQMEQPCTKQNGD
jgi:hypothetical protein